LSEYKQTTEEHLRTYKIGLRVPGSLVKEQNQLVIERELLHYLKNSYYNYNKKKCTLFSKKLIDANQSTLLKYKQVYEKLKPLSLKDITEKLEKNKKCLNSLQRNKPIFSSNSFRKKDLPKFTYKRNGTFQFHSPTPQDISLHDYQYLANNSLKLVSKHLNTLVVDNIASIPSLQEDLVRDAFELCQKEGRGYSETQLRNRFEIALACKTGIHSNLGRTAFYQLGTALKGYFDLRQKIQTISNMISNDFIDTIPVVLTYYSIPRHFILYISKSWNVDALWVRNTLIGWRRKLDSFLPQQFQIEGLNELFIELANYYQQYTSSEEEMKVIGKLQKKHILHLISHRNVDLSKLLPKSTFL